MASRLKSSDRITFSGPFFTQDPAQTFRQNARRMERGMSLAGQEAVQAALAVGEGARARISSGVAPSRVSGHVRAGVPFSPGGKGRLNAAIIAHVYVLNKGFSGAQGRALMAAYSRVEAETNAFRRVTAALRRSRAANAEELLKDIA